ncbi:MAG: hypothetical protein M3N47_06980 [Chloroflexota bacterium]|nr:hypothetical protein [Chloroflexota bacterium]
MKQPPAKRKSGAQPGNQNRKTHGAEAAVPAERLTAKARTVYDVLADDAPVRAADGALPRHDREIVVLLARALCRLEDVTTWLDEHGTFNRQGRLRERVLDREAKLRREVHSYLEALGMDPRARAKLGVDLAHTQSLASRMAEADFIDVDADDAD